MQEGAAGHSHLGEEGQDRSGIFHQFQSGSRGPTFSFCPTSAGSVVLKTSTALVCLAQMTGKESAKAATPAYSDEGGARSAGHRIPVKLPPLPEHGWKGRKLQLLDAVV